MSTHSVLRYEAALKVTGSAIYEAEVPAAGLLHAAFVQSPISCGDVSSVDATRAVDLPGFAAMVWASNARPTNAASVRSSRHGKGATPPAANLASTILPFSICNAAATDTIANSNDARSRILR